MKCYIYKIVNKVTNEKYVGQTTNFWRRKRDHFYKLKNNIHPNPKLQNSWNKYGEENFEITYQQYELSKEELDAKEIEEIAKEESFLHGFNLTKGGTGGNTRGKLGLSFDQFCFAYAGNKKYEGVINRTAQILACDSSTISALVREKSYDAYRERYNLLQDEEKEKYLKLFEDKLDLKNHPPKIQREKLSSNIVVDFLCFISVYGRGAEAAFLRSLQIPKGLGHRLKTQKNYFYDCKQQFYSLTEKEIVERAELAYIKYHIAAYTKKQIGKNIKVKIVDCAL